MRFNIPAFSITCGLIWGGAVLAVGLVNQSWPGYGEAFLQLCASIYPGYHPGGSVGQVIVGSLYGLVDGGIGGLIFSWLYNLLSGSKGTGAA